MTSKKNNSLLKTNKVLSEAWYSVLIFIFFVCKFFVITPEVNSYSSLMTTPYLLTYRLGFIPRAFIGSAVALFTDYLSYNIYKIIFWVVLLIMLAIVSLLLGKAISSAELEFKTTVKIFTLLFLTAPLSLTCLLEAEFGRLDTFLLIFTLIALVCLKHPFWKWLVPFFCFAAVATHSGYMTTYMPAIAIPLLYEVYLSKFSKKSILFFSSCCFVLIASFVYFQVFSPALKFANTEDFAKYLSLRTDTKINLPMIYYEYFSPLRQGLKGLVWPLTLSMALPYGLVLIAISLPLIIIFGSIWKNSVRCAENKFLKFIFLLCSAAPLAFIPAAVMGNDWNRWWAAVITCQFIILFYFIFSGEDSLKNSVEKVCIYFDRHTLIFLGILVFSGSLMFSNITTLVTHFMDLNIYFKYYGKYLKDFDFTIG